jgi:hypothetical protein
MLGPHMDVTGPYLQGLDPSGAPEFMQLASAEDARQTVSFWADHGATSFKAYTNITRDELRAAIEEAHRRGLKVTGHLCSVTYMEAIELAEPMTTNWSAWRRRARKRRRSSRRSWAITWR